MNTIKINDHGKTLMVAHRGLSGIEPENTNLAFVAAGNRSYFGVETDIHCTSDGNFILTHDDSATRVTGQALRIEETPFDVLRDLRVKDKDGTQSRIDIRMPTLEEYVRICKKYEKVCVLELKNHMPEEAVRTIIDRIEGEEYLDHVIFISFDFENLVFVRNYRPTQTVQFLFNAMSEGLMEKLVAHKFDVDVYFKGLSEELIQDFHKAGIKVNCWTVDTVEDADRLISWGVDYVTSNILE